MASRLSKAQLRTLDLPERVFEGTLFVCAAFSVLVTVAIISFSCTSRPILSDRSDHDLSDRHGLDAAVPIPGLGFCRCCRGRS